MPSLSIKPLQFVSRAEILVRRCVGAGGSRTTSPDLMEDLLVQLRNGSELFSECPEAESGFGTEEDQDEEGSVPGGPGLPGSPSLSSEGLQPLYTLSSPQDPGPRDPDQAASVGEKVLRYLAEVDQQNQYLQRRNKFRFHIIPDGNCLYRAVCRAVYGDQSLYRDLREQTLHHIADHLVQFSPIIEGDVGEFLIGAAQDGSWAGYPELLAMSHMLRVNIHLTTGGSRASPTVSTMLHCLGEEDPERPCIWLSWLSSGHYDALLDHRAPNPEYELWCRDAQVQRRRDEELARSMAASLSQMYLEQNGPM